VPTIKDSVFSEVALRRNAIEPERLRQARATQDELQAFGITKPVAMVILDKGLAPKEVVQGIAEEAESLWIRCPGCKEPNPVSAADRHGRLKCRSCEQGIEYKAERIPEEDLALSLRPSNERRRRRTPPPAASAPAPHPPALPARPDREAPPESARAAAPARHGRKRASQAGPNADAQASTRQAAVAAPFSLDHSPLTDITKFKAREIIAVSPCGRLYRIDGGGDFKALKVLDGALAGDKAQLKKWIKTMQTVQDLPRSASMKPVELHREGTTSYVVRPYFEDSKSLRAALDAKSEEIRAAEAVVKIAGAMLESLLAFHSANLAHGNIKPENVLFRSEGACFTDPGLSTLLQGLPPEDRALRLWESCRYHAPEVLEGEEPTAASDVYSVGRMLEEILDALEAEEQASEAAAWLRKLTGRMAARDPVARYPSAKEVLWDFHARGSSRKTRRDEAPPAGALEKAIPGRPGHRRPRPRAARLAGPAVLALVLAGLACQAVAWHSSRKAMASPGRDEEVSSRLIEERIRDLARRSAEVEPAEAERRWRELSDTFRGTPWEERIEEASRRPLEEVMRRRADEVTRAVAGRMPSRRGGSGRRPPCASSPWARRHAPRTRSRRPSSASRMVSSRMKAWSS
jgi:serine/threonine protein kinase